MEARCRDDFEFLCAVAVADARGMGGPAVADLLRRADWLADWEDALRCAEANLATALDRAAYDEGRRSRGAKASFGRLRMVRRALSEATALRKALRVAEPQRADLADQRDPELAVRWAMARVLRVELDALLAVVMAERGIDPAVARAPDELGERVEWAVRCGFLHPPDDPEADRLLALPQRPFRDRVAADAKSQAGRVAALRHPRVIAAWGQALVELSATSRAQAGLPPAGLPSLPRQVLGMARDEAYAVINARRFAAAVEQRHIEQARYRRHLLQEIGEAQGAWQAAHGYPDARHEANRRLVAAHPRLAADLRDHLAAYQEANTGRLGDRYRRMRPVVRAGLLDICRRYQQSHDG